MCCCLMCVVVRWSLFVVCCSAFVVWRFVLVGCMSFGVFVVCCLLFIVWCSLFVACWLLFVVCFVLFYIYVCVLRVLF